MKRDTKAQLHAALITLTLNHVLYLLVNYQRSPYISKLLTQLDSVDIYDPVLVTDELSGKDKFARGAQRSKYGHYVLLLPLHSCPEAFPFPIGLSQVSLKGEGVGSCISVLSAPLSQRESSGHPKDSHHWQLSLCPVCPTVPAGVLRTSQGLPPFAVVPVSCLSHSPIGSPQDIPRTLTLGG